MDLIDAGHVIGGIGLNQSMDGRAKIARQLKAAQAAEEEASGSTKLLGAPTQRGMTSANFIKGEKFRAEISAAIAAAKAISKHAVADKLVQSVGNVGYHLSIMVKNGDAVLLPNNTYVLTKDGKKKLKSAGKSGVASAPKPNKKPGQGGGRMTPQVAEALRMSILEIIKEQPKSTKQIAEIMGQTVNTITWQVHKSKKFGFLKTGGPDGLLITKAGLAALERSRIPQAAE